MGHVRTPAPQPWYWKDGTPMNPELIRRVVARAQVSAAQPAAAPALRTVIEEVARYYAERMERNLIRLLLAEFDKLGRPMPTTGDAGLDARRHARRLYQRQYRARKDTGV